MITDYIIDLDEISKNISHQIFTRKIFCNNIHYKFFAPEVAGAKK